MAAVWTVKTDAGEVLEDFTGASHLEVARKVLPTRYDPFRLHVSPSYRELFDRALRQILKLRHWEIVRVR